MKLKMYVSVQKKKNLEMETIKKKAKNVTL